MGGTNPYLTDPKPELPTKKYKITFSKAQDGKDVVVEVDPAKIPYSVTGLPGSILEIALASHVDIDHACGGVCACSTCHIYVKEGMNSCSNATDAEQDMIDLAPDLKPNSRLACQCVPNGDSDIVVSVPDWNRNLVREGN